jgi:hypothetical protein
MTHGTLQRLQKSSVPRWVLAAKKFAEAAETDEHARKRLRADDGADAKLAGRHINELRSNVERQPPEDEAAEAFEQLQRAIHDKVRRQQEVQREAVRTRVDEAQRIVDEMKLVNARERDNFETENRRAIENVAAADCAQKEVVAVAVHELNQELIRMQEAGEAVQLQIGRCAVLLAEAIDGAAELEISSLAALKAMVDEEIWLVQKAVAAAIEKENPMRYLTKYLDGEK